MTSPEGNSERRKLYILVTLMTLFLAFWTGLYIFTLSWAPQITELSLHASVDCDRQNHKLVQFWSKYSNCCFNTMKDIVGDCPGWDKFFCDLQGHNQWVPQDDQGPKGRSHIRNYLKISPLTVTKHVPANDIQVNQPICPMTQTSLSWRPVTIYSLHTYMLVIEYFTVNNTVVTVRICLEFADQCHKM